MGRKESKIYGREERGGSLRRKRDKEIADDTVTRKTTTANNYNNKQKMQA